MFIDFEAVCLIVQFIVYLWRFFYFLLIMVRLLVAGCDNLPLVVHVSLNFVEAFLHEDIVFLIFVSHGSEQLFMGLLEGLTYFRVIVILELFGFLLITELVDKIVWLGRFLALGLEGVWILVVADLVELKYFVLVVGHMFRLIHELGHDFTLFMLGLIKVFVLL